jgi:rare lipoprotein A
VTAPQPPAPAGDPIAALAAAPAPAAAAAPAEIVAATPAPEPLAAPSAVYLQLGAFGSRENAESYLSRVKAQLEGWTERLQVLMRDGYYRVHAGPYDSAVRARAAAERLLQALGTRPVLVTR